MIVQEIDIKILSVWETDGKTMAAAGSNYLLFTLRQLLQPGTPSIEWLDVLNIEVWRHILIIGIASDAVNFSVTRIIILSYSEQLHITLSIIFGDRILLPQTTISKRLLV